MQDRLTELEIRYTDMELTIESLQDTLFRQQRQLTAMSHRIEDLEARLRSAAQADILSPAEEPPPPHY